MVMTILEGRVSKEYWSALKQEFKQASDSRDPGLEQSYLVQSTREPDLWRIMTIWSSREALDAMRKTTETPRGVLMFRSAHTEPALSVFDIVEQIHLA